MTHSIRTANQHRWVRRVSSDVRENLRLGTRQNNGRNFGIRPALTQVGAAVKDFKRLFIKNTGPC